MLYALEKLKDEENSPLVMDFNEKGILKFVSEMSWYLFIQYLSAMIGIMIYKEFTQSDGGKKITDGSNTFLATLCVIGICASWVVLKFKL